MISGLRSPHREKLLPKTAHLPHGDDDIQDRSGLLGVTERLFPEPKRTVRGRPIRVVHAVRGVEADRLAVQARGFLEVAVLQHVVALHLDAFGSALRAGWHGRLS